MTLLCQALTCQKTRTEGQDEVIHGTKYLHLIVSLDTDFASYWGVSLSPSIYKVNAFAGQLMSQFCSIKNESALETLNPTCNY